MILYDFEADGGWCSTRTERIREEVEKESVKVSEEASAEQKHDEYEPAGPDRGPV